MQLLTSRWWSAYGKTARVYRSVFLTKLPCSCEQYLSAQNAVKGVCYTEADWTAMGVPGTVAVLAKTLWGAGPQAPSGGGQ